MQDHLRLFGGSSIDLDALANEASNLFLNQNIPLTDAVVKVANAYDNITPEQIKRVVETANRQTFLVAFEKEAQKTIDFEIADPKVVLNRLNSENSCHTKVASFDYIRDVPVFKSVDREQELRDLFSTGSEKVASASEPFDLHSFVRLRDGLESAIETLSDGVRNNKHIVKQAEQDFHLEVKRHLHDGHDIQDVACLVCSYCPKYASAILTDLAASLNMEISEENHKEKLANFDSPLVQAFSGYAVAIEKQAELSFAYKDSSKKLKEMNQVFDSLQAGLYSDQNKEASLKQITKVVKPVVAGVGITGAGAAGFKAGTNAGNPNSKNPMRRGK